MTQDEDVRLDCLTCGTTVRLSTTEGAATAAAARDFFTHHPTCVTVIDLTDRLVGWTHPVRAAAG